MLRLFVIPASIVILHFLLEWLFFVSKPSFLSRLSLEEQTYVLFRSVLIPSLLVLSICWLLALFEHVFSSGKHSSLFSFCIRLVPTFIFACLLFGLVNNFSYSVFSVSPLTARDIGRVISAIIFLLLMLYANRFVNNLLREPVLQRHKKLLAICVLTLLTISLSLNWITFRINDYRISPDSVSNKTPVEDLPNIVLLSSDAVSAEHLSIYGYQRDTTPFLSQHNNDWLIFENAFSNVNRSAGSILSLLTGKSPLETTVLSSPDILRGKNSFQHLPSILKSIGYFNLELSVRDFADSADLNLSGAFDFANGRRFDTPLFKLLERRPLLLASDEFYFLSLVWRRITELLLHSFGIITVIPQYEQVTKHVDHFALDRTRIDTACDFLTNSSQPVFAHIHLLGTHGPLYHSQSKIFTGSRLQTDDREIDFYDNAIVDFDSHIQSLLTCLSQKNILDKTLVIVHSDHGRDFRLGQRIPLLIRFPHLTYFGKVKENISLEDIAPTVLQFLELPIPSWMTGLGLLNTKLDALRPIYGGADRYPFENYYSARPPYFNFETVEVMICQRKFALHPLTGELEVTDISSHSSPCAEDLIPDAEHAQILLDQALQRVGASTGPPANSRE